MSNVKVLHAGVVLFAIGISGMSLGADNKTNEQKFIADFESRLTLPPGSHKLQEYVRHYKFFGAHANSKVQAIYLFEDGVGRVEVVSKGGLPKVNDGGCDVVNLVLTRAGKIVSIQCSGKA